MTEEELRRRRAEITDEIMVIGQEAQESIQAAKVEAVEARRRDAYWWLIMVVTSMTFAAASVIFAWHNTNVSEQKFCALMTTSVTQAQARVAGYDASPPTTEAGIAQRAQAVIALDQVRTLKQDLGCPPDKGR